MKTKVVFIAMLALIFILTTVNAAKSEKLIEKIKENADSDYLLELTQFDNAPLPKSQALEKVLVIHYKNGYAKVGLARTKTTKCYGFLGNGVKWKTLPINYVVNTTNSQGLSEEFITSAIASSVQEWDNHTSASLFGTYTIDPNATWDDAKPDGRNEFVFGNYPEEGVIAVTVIWGYFQVAPKNRKITEFDVLFDTDFTWGNAEVDPSKMDLQNIATHEIGHGIGLKDLYTTSCSEETMYGYSSYGETKKRTLNTGDIEGVQLLYGS